MGSSTGSPVAPRPSSSGVTVARHSLGYVIARGLPACINLLAMALYTRLLAPEDYGQYALVIAGVGLANMVLFQWLRLSVLRFLPAHEQRQDAFFSTVATGYLVLAAVAALMGLILFVLAPDSFSRGLIVLGVCLLWVQAFYELNLGVTVIQLAPARYGLLAIVKTLAATLIGAGLAWAGFGAKGLIAGLLIGMLVAVALRARVWAVLRARLVDRVLFRELAIYGLPLSATFVLGFIVSGSDRFLIGWFLGSGLTGLYAAGYDLASQSLGVALMVVNLAAYPLAVRALEQVGEDAAREQLSRNIVLLLAVAVPGTVALAILAPNIAELFLGADYRAAATKLIPWIALGALLAGIRSYHFDLSFQLGRRTVGQVWVTMTAAVVNIALNVLWIPRHGVAGAAWATVVAYGVALGLSWAMGRRIFRLPFPASEAWRIVCASGAMAAVLWALRTRSGFLMLLAQIAIGGLVYGLLILILNVGNLRTKVTGRFRSTA